MSDSLTMIKEIIKSLRQSPREPGIYREKGQVPLRQRGGMVDEMVGRPRQRMQYDHYKMIQDRSGESPVSYDEWLKGQ